MSKVSQRYQGWSDPGGGLVSVCVCVCVCVCPFCGFVMWLHQKLASLQLLHLLALGLFHWSLHHLYCVLIDS